MDIEIVQVGGLYKPHSPPPFSSSSPVAESVPLSSSQDFFFIGSRVRAATFAIANNSLLGGLPFPSRKIRACFKLTPSPPLAHVVRLQH